jgi:hypothetical protein
MWGRLCISTFCEDVFEYEILPVRVVMLTCTSRGAMKPVGAFTVGHRENALRLYFDASARIHCHPNVTGRSFGRGYFQNIFFT